MSDIIINYSKDIFMGTAELLRASRLASLIKPGMKVAVKPNMVIDKPPSEGATTHPEVVEAIIVCLRELGIKHIVIIESSWIGGDTKRTYKVCGLESLSKRLDVPLYDLKDDRIIKVDVGEYIFEICERALKADFLINVPVLKAHCQTNLTCNLKNLKGCISDREKRRFHTMGLHKPIAYLSKAIKTHFCVIDGICGDLTFEEGGTPVERNMLIAGEDPLMLDSFCAPLIGLRPDEVEYIPIAAKIGIGRLYDAGKCSVTELNTDKKPVISAQASGLVRQLSAHINEDGACSACYSALINALYRSRYSGEQISIGQSFKGKPGSLGCGSCTSGFTQFVAGCPPTADKIAQFLRNIAD